MKKMKLLTIVLALILAMAAFAGCGNSAEPAETTEPEGSSAVVEEPAVEEEVSSLEGEIMLAAAASLENAFVGDLIPMFNELHPNVTITGTYDSSGKLQTQIEEGLEAQVFFSAAQKQMNALVEGGFIDESTVVDLLENEIVLITRNDSGTAVTSFDNILDAESIAVGDPASVPAGQYAQEVLTSLGSWATVEGMASFGTNVTEVLNQVAEGSAEVGIVYATDAASIADKVTVIATAPEGSLETPVIYPVGLTVDLGDKEEVAKAFIEFLQTPDALAVFESYGFKAL